MKKCEFINQYLMYSAEFYIKGELPNVEEIWAWQENTERTLFARFSSRYVPDRQSWNATITVDDQYDDDKSYALSAFGGTRLSATQKLYVLVAVCGFMQTDTKQARGLLDELEARISDKLRQALKE